jgi:hypothetical protein
MATDPITKELLEKYGPRCICCGGLATRLVIYGVQPPVVSFKWGNLLMRSEIPFEIRESQEEEAFSDELERLNRTWVQEVNQSEAILLVTPNEPNVELIGTSPVNGAPLCDSCGDPKLDYQDLDVAPLVRAIVPDPVIPEVITPEPIRTTRFERITKDED